MFGMSVRSCVEYYNRTAAEGAWDIAAVAEAVQKAKEELYQQLTATGIDAFGGAKALILEARSLGIVVGVGSSGVCSHPSAFPSPSLAGMPWRRIMLCVVGDACIKWPQDIHEDKHTSSEMVHVQLRCDPDW